MYLDYRHIHGHNFCSYKNIDTSTCILVQMDGLKLDGFTTTNAYHKGRYDDRKYLTKYVKQLDYHNTAGIKQHYYNVHVALH